jgi:RNase adaptor protein for sRNA GlmZ degradation
METLQWFLANNRIPVETPELSRCLEEIAFSGRFAHHDGTGEGPLKIQITSFSYMNGLPDDHTGHGGGHIFDCRALPNPGREGSMRKFNGKDDIIIDYLKKRKEVEDFLADVYSIVDRSAENYLSRGFGNLSVSFGCTGGQHRSVYCAEALARHLANKFPGVVVKVNHRELERV